MLRDSYSSGTFNQRVYYTHDANYDVTGVISTAGTVLQRQVYTAYGTVSFYNSSWTSTSDGYSLTHLWQGGKCDATTGMYLFQARWYSVSLERWMSVDPAQADGLNWYRGMVGNAVSISDPTGLDGGDSKEPTLSITQGSWTTVLGKGGKCKTSTRIDTITIMIPFTSRWSNPSENTAIETTLKVLEKSGLGGDVAKAAQAIADCFTISTIEYNHAFVTTWQRTVTVKSVLTSDSSGNDTWKSQNPTISDGPKTTTVEPDYKTDNNPSGQNTHLPDENEQRIDIEKHLLEIAEKLNESYGGE